MAKYTQLETQHTQLQQQDAANRSQIDSLRGQLASKQAHVGRLQQALHFTVQSDMLFKSGSWQMSSRGQTALAGIAQQLGPQQQVKVVVNGYTDNTPVGAGLMKKGIASNDDLSQKRAEAVMAWLTEHGVNPSMISAKGWGEANPVASNDTKAGRAQNRRVEIATDASVATQ